jgi:hypothetical protein
MHSSRRGLFRNTRAYLREATLRTVRNPGTVTLARGLRPLES